MNPPQNVIANQLILDTARLIEEVKCHKQDRPLQLATPTLQYPRHYPVICPLKFTCCADCTIMNMRQTYIKHDMHTTYPRPALRHLYLLPFFPKSRTHI